MNTSPVIRIVDENLNRLSEGLRVLEDIARMVLDHPELTLRLKTLRHKLIRSQLDFNLDLLRSRNPEADVGASLDVEGESRERDLSLLAVANSRRVQESLRVLEEFAKLPEMVTRLDSAAFRQARFEVYTLEKDLVSLLMRREKAARISGLYVIIDTQVLGNRSGLEAARQVIEAGVKVIQLRAKSLPKRTLLQLAGDLQKLCREAGVLFIINDYLDITLAVGADGLHLGQEDLPVETARRLLPPDKILGCSVTTVEQAGAAVEAGADYLAVGAIFQTSSKNDIEVVGTERLHLIKQAVRKPVVAIGGINRSNARQAMEAGADSLCVISAVLQAPDIHRAARELIEVIEAKNEKIN